MQHNGYKTLGEHPTLAQLHPSTARITPDDDGLLPDWVIYHELVATARTFLSKVPSPPPPLIPFRHMHTVAYKLNPLFTYKHPQFGALQVGDTSPEHTG